MYLERLATIQHSDIQNSSPGNLTVHKNTDVHKKEEVGRSTGQKHQGEMRLSETGPINSAQHFCKK